MRLKYFLAISFILASLYSNASAINILQGVEYKVDTLSHYKAGPGTSYTSLNLKSDSKNLNIFVLEMEMKGYIKAVAGGCYRAMIM